MTTFTMTTAQPEGKAVASGYFETEAVSLGPNTYLAYPHANLFGRDGRAFVFARAGEATGARLVWKNGWNGRETPLPVLKRRRPKCLSYYDVARQADLVATTDDDSLWVCERDASAWRRVYQAPQGATLQPNPSLSADGKRALVGLVAVGEAGYSCVEVDVRTGVSQTLFSPPFHASHFHLCPHDESWIGYCHEEWADFKAGKPTKNDRVWVWHATQAPRGKFVFGGPQPDGSNLNTGHERWNFHDTSALVVAYRTSVGGPKGIHEVWADGRAPRLVSPLNHFLHVNINDDGRWVVADTAGPFDPDEAPIPGDGGNRSDIVLVERATGKTRLLARSHMTVHPYHAHPILSPDAGWVLYNDSSSVLENGVPGAVLARTGVVGDPPDQNVAPSCAKRTNTMTASTLTAPVVTAPTSRYFEAEAISLGANTYLTYPHCNPFGPDGRTFLFGRTLEDGVALVWKEGPQGRETPLPVLRCRTTPKGFCYYDVARLTNLVVAMADDTLWVFEPGATTWRRLYQAPPGAALQHLPSVRGDGSRVVFGQGKAPANVGEAMPPGSACLEVDTRSGAVRALFEQSWRANHFHFCPHDESWIGFSHEEWPEWKANLPTTGDRMWAWHAQHAPRGKFLFGGAQPDGTHINTGHERWGYGDTSALTVVYRTSTFDPKGIYEVWAQERAPQLVSVLRNFLHVDASRDGKWIVADTAGPFDPDEASIPGDGNNRSDIVLVEKVTGKQRLLARSHITVHPYHPHPILGGDNAWVLYNDSASPFENGAPGAIAVRTGVTP